MVRSPLDNHELRHCATESSSYENHVDERTLKQAGGSGYPTVRPLQRFKTGDRRTILSCPSGPLRTAVCGTVLIGLLLHINISEVHVAQNGFSIFESQRWFRDWQPQATSNVGCINFTKFFPRLSKCLDAVIVDSWLLTSCSRAEHPSRWMINFSDDDSYSSYVMEVEQFHV